MYVIGLISGTSVDGIDAALVELSGTDLDLQVRFIAGETYPYPESLRAQILAVCGGQPLSVAELAQLDDAIAHQFAIAAQTLNKGHPRAELIGSHGQTVFHRPPDRRLGYSLQLGRGDAIATFTHIPTVSNFRAADLAASGHGAPLVPKVDAYLFSHPTQPRCVQNLGGIGNVTYLPPRQTPDWENTVIGWDTGPGNALIDLAVQQLTQGQQTYDPEGRWAAQGTPQQTLVQQWLQQEFFQQPPPKSTGRELFGEAYLQQCWADAQPYRLSPADWLATLSELTAASIVQSYQQFLPQMPEVVLLGGGGSRNRYLIERLQGLLPQVEIITTDRVGVDAEFKEAIAFAVLAYWRYACAIPGNLPQVTGAACPQLLGEIHLPVSQIT